MAVKFGMRFFRRAPLTVLAILGTTLLAAIWLVRHQSEFSSATTQSPFASSGANPTVVVILGGGVTADGKAPEHTQQRLNLALDVYKELDTNALFIPLSGGTPHKPNPVDQRGFPVWESTAAAKGLLERGVPAERIVEESFSLDTIGNAYFLRSVHMEPSGLRKMVVITNDWHMPRTRAIFDFVFSLPSHTGAASTPFEITYRAAPAGISDAHLLETRKSKEAGSLAYFETSVAPGIKAMQEMHWWLFTKHGAYATSRLRQSSVAPAVSEELLKTY
jgi:uncharacterized SAM-binding protein YcdF (DUF218 family)